jgi:hypothetical protein
MRQTLYKRLRQLEEASACNHRQSYNAEAVGQRAIEKIRLFLRMVGVEQEGTESLAETSARALEISCSELRRSLAAGIDPFHKYLADRGFFEAIKERKAAGTWPSG